MSRIVLLQEYEKFDIMHPGTEILNRRTNLGLSQEN